MVEEEEMLFDFGVEGHDADEEDGALRVGKVGVEELGHGFEVLVLGEDGVLGVRPEFGFEEGRAVLDAVADDGLEEEVV